MQKRHSAAIDPAVRPVRKAWLVLTKYRKIVLTLFLCLTVTGSGAVGYLLANGQTALAAPLNDSKNVEAFNSQLSAQNELCTEIEQINLANELATQKAKANTLEKSIDSIEDTILDALMSNLTTKLISRSSSSVSSYSQEAKNLISLSRKLKTFSKTPEASEVDLTTYKQAIDKRLLRLPTLKPIPGGLDGYGWRIHPIFGYRQFHAAVDMGAPKGTPIKASATGYVTESSYNSSAGNYIIISHGNGFETFYLHCSKLYVHAGQTVNKGAVIGSVGSTGTSTAPHLHFAIHLNGSPINPAQMIME